MERHPLAYAVPPESRDEAVEVIDTFAGSSATLRIEQTSLARGHIP